MVIAVLLLAACQQTFGLTPVSGSDAPVDVRTCQRGTPFEAGTAVPIEGEYSVEAARFVSDRSRAYVALCPVNTNFADCDLYDSVFDPIAGLTQHDKLGAVSTDGVYDSYPTMTTSGDFIIFSSRRSGTNRNWVAMKTNGSFEVPALTQLALAPGETVANEPYLLEDSRTLYFSADGPAVGVDRDLYRASGDPPAFGGSAVIVPGTESSADDYAPAVSSDELELFFASNEHNGGNDGEIDIFTATRDAASEPFSPRVRVPELSTPATNDWPVWLSPDGCSLYYIHREGLVSTLFVASR